MLFEPANIEVNRCLGFLDRSSIDPCSDEILMNTAACPAALCCFHINKMKFLKGVLNFLKNWSPGIGNLHSPQGVQA